MSASNDGGPAFPGERTNTGGFVEEYGCMSLRDYFAARAMQAMIGLAREEWTDVEIQELFTRMVASSYRIADAMLAERTK